MLIHLQGLKRNRSRIKTNDILKNAYSSKKKKSFPLILGVRFNKLFQLTGSLWCSVADMCRLGWNEGGDALRWTRRLFAWKENSL